MEEACKYCGHISPHHYTCDAVIAKDSGEYEWCNCSLDKETIKELKVKIENLETELRTYRRLNG